MSASESRITNLQRGKQGSQPVLLFGLVVALASACGRLAEDADAGTSSDGSTEDAGDTSKDGSPDATAALDAGSNDSDARTACEPPDSGLVLDGGLFYTSPTVIPLQGYPIRMAIGDVTGDGRKDLVVSVAWNYDPGDRLVLFRQNACGGLDAPETFPPQYANNGWNAALIGDLNADGRTDIVTTNDENIVVFAQNADGTIASGHYYPTLYPLYDGFIHDFNQDGINDLLMTSGGEEYLFIQTSPGVLAQPTGFFVNDTLDTVSINDGDFNGDGLDDIATVTRTQLYVARQASRGTFSESDVYDVADGGYWDVARHSVSGDFNGDGRTDIAIHIGAQVDPDGGGTLAIYPQTADGGMGTPVNYDDPDYSSAVGEGDIDGDGRVDFVQIAQALTIYLQTNTGTLAAPQSFVVPAPHDGALAIGDLNGDGKADVVTATVPGNGPASLVVSYSAP
jgi:FG-GAP-like repeat